MDKNNDGEIDFEEFKAAVLGENGDHSKYQVGESIQYLSTTHDKWFDAKVVAVVVDRFKFGVVNGKDHPPK